MISLILATDKNGLLGSGDKIPWMGDLPSDMKYFKDQTTGHVVIMGRNTYDSIGKALPNRTNIVITSKRPNKSSLGDFYDAYFYPSIDEVLNEYYEYSNAEDEVFVIGGASIYKQFLPFADRIYHTLIDHEFDGDVYFPLSELSEWEMIDSEYHYPDDKNKYYHSFNVLERR